MREFLKAVLPPRVMNALRALKHSPEGTRPVFGMTGTAEQAYYAECARSLRDTPGAIVDVGCWMGSTCVSLAKGLGDAGEKQAGMIYAFDRFIWEDWMNYQSQHVLCDYVAGESFLPEARRRTREYRDRITLVQADLTLYEWNQGEIKLLLVDAMKSPELARAIACSFYPSLRVGAILIHQDFKHFYTPWIHILQHRLRSLFRFVRNVPVGGTVAFEVLEPISRGVVARSAGFSAIEDAEADAAFEYSLELVGDTGRAAVAAAHVMHFVHRGQAVQARARVARYQGLPTNREFAAAIERLQAIEGRG
jgi:hypothetical protein